MTLIPPMVSAKRVLISAILMRRILKMSRALTEKTAVATNTIGITAKAARASFQLRAIRTTPIPNNRNRSLKIKVITDVNNSSMFCTSLVTRVTSRPTGLRVKNAIERLWMCVNRRIRRLCMIIWPVYSMISF